MDKEDWLREVNSGFVGTKKDIEDRSRRRKELDSELQLRQSRCKNQTITDDTFTNAVLGLQTASILLLEMENTGLPKELKAEVKKSLDWLSATYLSTAPMGAYGRPLPMPPLPPGARPVYYYRPADLDKRALLTKIDELDHLETDLCFMARGVYETRLPDHGDSFVHAVQTFSQTAYDHLNKQLLMKESEDKYEKGLQPIRGPALGGQPIAQRPRAPLRQKIRDPFVAEMSLDFEEKTFRTPAMKALGKKHAQVKMKTRKLLYIDNELYPLQQGLEKLRLDSTFANFKPIYPLDLTSPGTLGELEFQCHNLLEGLQRYSNACPGKTGHAQDGILVMNYPESNPEPPTEPSAYDRKRAELLGAKYVPKCTECGNFSANITYHRDENSIPYCARLKNLVELYQHCNNILECLDGWVEEEPRGTVWSPPLVSVMRNGKRKQMKITTYRRLQKEGKL